MNDQKLLLEQFQKEDIYFSVTKNTRKVTRQSEEDENKCKRRKDDDDDDDEYVTSKENDHKKQQKQPRMNTTNALLCSIIISIISISIFSIISQCVLVTLLPSALSMISPRWVMTINALMTAHSLTPTHDKSSTRCRLLIVAPMASF